MRHFLAFLLEIVAWSVLSAGFLFVYVRFALSTDAVQPHIRLVAGLLWSLILLRLALVLTIRNPLVLRIATTIAISTMLAVMLLYYALVAIGLNSWGRVISWELMSGYAAQSAQLADVLGLSLFSIAGALMLGFAGVLGAMWLYGRHFDWAPHFVRYASAPLLATVLLSGCAIVVIESYSFLAAPPARQGEPVSLTFFPLEGAWNLQGLAIDSVKAAGLDRVEDAARAAYRPKRGGGRRNLILIVSDALRADHMSVYGYARDTTPMLSRLDDAGLLRKAAPLHATCASSACGLFSLGSSKFAHQFSTRPFTLQEALQLHGYRIHMILGGDHTTFYDLRKIYGAVDSYFDGRTAGAFKYVNDDRLVLDRVAGFVAWDGVPVMLQFHLMSTHLLGKRHESAIRFVPSGNYALPENQNPGPDGRPVRAINYYDNGVVQADATIKSILETLRRKGYLSDALVVITGDHGESLGEHGLFQHSNSVHEEALRIPLVLISYGYKPSASIDAYERGSQVDIAPTIFAELGLPRPRTWEGVPLQEAAAREFSYFREHSQIGLYDHRDRRNFWKYWVDQRTAQEYAFNLSLDPGEEHNSMDEVPAELKREWRFRLLPATSVDSAPRKDSPQGSGRRQAPDASAAIN